MTSPRWVGLLCNSYQFSVLFNSPEIKNKTPGECLNRFYSSQNLNLVYNGDAKNLRIIMLEEGQWLQ